MKMLNRAIEDASDFQAFRDKLQERNVAFTSGSDQFLDDPTATRRFTPLPQRELGENRATYRARVKAERRAVSKQVKA